MACCLDKPAAATITSFNLRVIHEPMIDAKRALPREQPGGERRFRTLAHSIEPDRAERPKPLPRST
jgi:hypothetical protein